MATSLETGARLFAIEAALALTAALRALSALGGDVRQEAAHLRRAHEDFARMGATGRARATAAALAELPP